MYITAGLVGLPNVGKSTLFNTLTNSSVPAENYPFCTIAPHLALAIVPDKRMQKLQHAYKSSIIIPAMVQFIDIAGLVKGASSGEGLGNQFLSHVRTADVIIQVTRCFEDATITRIDTVDPLADLEIIMTELMLKDTESISKRQSKIEHLLKATRNKPQESIALQKERDKLQQALATINSGDYVAMHQFHHDPELPTDLLLSAKKFLIVANYGEEETALEARAKNIHIQALQKKFGTQLVIPICIRLEYELSKLSPEEAQEMACMMGLEESGIQNLIQKTYEQLGLITFFTCGPKEIHAWPLKRGKTVREAAGEIHSDLQRGFICAEVLSYSDLVSTGSETKAKLEGKMRTEGQDYIVQDGDIIIVKFNV